MSELDGGSREITLLSRTGHVGRVLSKGKGKRLSGDGRETKRGGEKTHSKSILAVRSILHERILVDVGISTELGDVVVS